ncbi:hypothetical protein Tco_1076410, partial [Tanacetum coccineum]
FLYLVSCVMIDHYVAFPSFRHCHGVTLEAAEGIERIEEEMRELRQSVVGLRGVVESSITKQTKVSTWMISCMTHLMDVSGRTYQAFDSTLVGS